MKQVAPPTQEDKDWELYVTKCHRLTRGPDLMTGGFSMTVFLFAPKGGRHLLKDFFFCFTYRKNVHKVSLYLNRRVF